MTIKLESSILKNLNQNDISSYLKEINKFPLLSHEEEYSLADDWIKNKCLNIIYNEFAKPCSKHGNFCRIQKDGCIKNLKPEKILDAILEAMVN